MKKPLASSSVGLGGCALAAALALLLSSCRPPETSASIEPDPVAPVVEYVTTQEILTPLPLRVRLPARYRAERVLVFFRTWGSAHWEAIELARAGQTWTGEVSCRQVSTVTGDTRYFFVAVDDEGREVIGSGWPEWPHVATVVGKLPEGPRALAGMDPPVRCHDPADCPPDFPGCPVYALRRPVCRYDGDCRDGSRCDWDGYCGDAAPEPGEASDDDRLAAVVRATLQPGNKMASARYSSSH